MKTNIHTNTHTYMQTHIHTNVHTYIHTKAPLHLRMVRASDLTSEVRVPLGFVFALGLAISLLAFGTLQRNFIIEPSARQVHRISESLQTPFNFAEQCNPDQYSRGFPDNSSRRSGTQSAGLAPVFSLTGHRVRNIAKLVIFPEYLFIQLFAFQRDFYSGLFRLCPRLSQSAGWTPVKRSLVRDNCGASTTSAKQTNSTFYVLDFRNIAQDDESSRFTSQVWIPSFQHSLEGDNLIHTCLTVQTTAPSGQHTQSGLATRYTQYSPTKTAEWAPDLLLTGLGGEYHKQGGLLDTDATWWDQHPAGEAYTLWCARAQGDTSPQTDYNFRKTLTFSQHDPERQPASNFEAWHCCLRLLILISCLLWKVCTLQPLCKPRFSLFAHRPSRWNLITLALNQLQQCQYISRNHISCIFQFCTSLLLRYTDFRSCRDHITLIHYSPASKRIARSCTSGPKSGQHRRRKQYIKLLPLVFFLLMISSIADPGGEGYFIGSCDGMKANFDNTALEHLLQAKTHDTAPPCGFGHTPCPQTLKYLRPVQKRSLKRAYAQAQKWGSAWYRGRWMPLQDFPTVLQHRTASIPSQSQSEPKATASPIQPSSRSRFRVTHVNVGGLSAERLGEIKHWASNCGQDILILTETRWSFTSEWEDAHWAHLHTGSPDDKADGILFLISKKACHTTQIGFHDVIPGRLGHLRIHFQRRALDIIGCYQHADHRTTACRNARAQFWDKLDQFLTTLPKRNSFLLGGDLNCSLPSDGLHVGTSYFTWRSSKCTGPCHSDQHHLQRILRSHGFLAVNTWHSKDPPTFQHGFRASRIDYFLMRKIEVDVHARAIQFFPNAGFLPISGPLHIPMSCTIRKIPYHKAMQPPFSSCTYHQRLQSRADWMQDNDTWQALQHQHCACWRDFLTRTCPEDTVIDDMHQALMPSFQFYYPKNHNLKHPTPAIFTQLFQSKWEDRKCLNDITRPTLRGVFKAWFHAARFSLLKKLQFKISRERKRQKVIDLLHEVNQAAVQHDSFRIYQAVHRFTPKQPQKRIRLRTSTGAIADADTVLHMIREHVQAVWAGPSHISYECPFPPGVPFTCEELAQEISRLPVIKSVAKPYLPGLCWKVRAWDTAEFVYKLLQTWWGRRDFFIPRQWKDAWLTFIHKPNKVPDRPSHLRPLALMEPIGKCVLGLLNKQLAQQLRTKIAAWPQFAFCAHRSPLDAIKRVIAHCQQTRQMICRSRRTVHQ